MATSLEDKFYSILEKVISSEIINGTSIAINSTKIYAYKKSQPKNQLKNDTKSADFGYKNDTCGNKIKWFGYKLHILCYCKIKLPLSILLSPASYYYDELPIPLIKKYLTKHWGVLNTKYYCMNSGYNHEKTIGILLIKLNCSNNSL